MRPLIAAMLAASAMLLTGTARADTVFDRHGVNAFQYIQVPTLRRSSRKHATKAVRHRAKRIAVRAGERSAKFAVHAPGCPPIAFCGCATARHFGINDRGLWLAANWLRFPRAVAAPGMAAARRGHVFAILRVIRPGLVLAYDPNSGGGRTRVHQRLLAGFTVVNPHRSKTARSNG